MINDNVCTEAKYFWRRDDEQHKVQKKMLGWVKIMGHYGTI